MSVDLQVTAAKETMESWLTAMGLPANNITVFAMECRRTMDLKNHPGGWQGRIVAEVVMGNSMIAVVPPHVEVLKVEGEALPAVEPETRTFGTEDKVEAPAVVPGLLGEPVTLFGAPDIPF